MSDTEAIMWAVEKDPALRSDFCNLTILDGVPDLDRMRHTMARAVAAIPRLGQRVVGAPLRIVPPAFADDPTFDINAHVRRIALPGDGSDRALLDLCGSLAEQPLDRARPLWEFTLIEGLRDGRAGLLQKVHHTITDGVGGLKLSMAFIDFEPNPEHPSPLIPLPTATAPGDRNDTPMRVTRTAVIDAAARGAGVAHRALGGAGQMVVRPWRIPSRALDTARLFRSLQRQVFDTQPARSDVMGARSLTRHFEIHALSLPAARAAARALGGSINDLYIAGLAGALGRYHEHLGSSVGELRLAMPVSTRSPGDDAPNRFVPARVVIPIQPVDDPRALFTEVQAGLTAARNEAAIDAAEELAGLLTGLPTAMLVAMSRAQTRTTDFTATNLRGSPVPLYIAGRRAIASYPFGPRAATALNVTMMSYGDELHLGLNIDPAAIIDIKAFMSNVDASFDAFLAFG
jgi:diacylglycerol O-acyltransferase / wax synthase